MSTLERLLGPHTKLRSFALVFIASALIYNFPVLLSWLPKETQDALQLAADTVLKNGVLAALLFAKQSNVSGNGTLDMPAMKPSGTGGNRVLLMLAIASLTLTGCADFKVRGEFELPTRQGTATVHSDGKTIVVGYRLPPPGGLAK